MKFIPSKIDVSELTSISLWDGPIGVGTHQSFEFITELINSCTKLTVVKNICPLLCDIKDEILTNLTDVSWKDRPDHTSIHRLIDNCTKLTDLDLYITETSVAESDIQNLLSKNSQLKHLNIKLKTFLDTSKYFPIFLNFQFTDFCPNLTHLTFYGSCEVSIRRISAILLERVWEFLSVNLFMILGTTHESTVITYTYNTKSLNKTIFISTQFETQIDLIDFFDIHREFTKVELKFQYWEYISGAIFDTITEVNVDTLTEFMYNGGVMDLN
jgi:hypothetical protein